jgi:SAM-dependent methyltransferase
MTQLFDTYDKTYCDVVQSSIEFSGLSHSFFMAAKAIVIRDVVEAHFDARKPEALDVGCGVGALHPFVRDQFARLCGVDVSATCVERARADNPDNEYCLCEGTTLPYGDASFDLTLAVCVMHHVLPLDWPSFMRKMRRVVRPGGLVCIIEHNPLNPLTRLSVARCEFDRDAVLLRASRVERLMAEANLKNIATRYFLFLPSATPIARRIERNLGWLPLGGQYMTCGVV